MEQGIKCKVQFEGIHNWKDCSLEEVSFLKFPHRHIFTIISTKKVTHLNRNVEFILLGRKILDFINSKFEKVSETNSALSLGSNSCEMIAELVLNEFELDECEVWEDMENCGWVKKQVVQ